MFVKKSTYGGIDWHDCYTVNLQLKYDDSFFIPNDKCKEVIIKQILEDFPDAEEDKVRDAILNETDYTFVIYNEETDEKGNVVKKCEESVLDNGNVIYENSCTIYGKELHIAELYWWGQISYDTYYYVYDIEEKNIRYVVQENFLVPTKGCPSVERIYTDIFNNEKEALEYYESFQLHDPQKHCKSVKEILVADYEKVIATDWYKFNMEAIELMNKQNKSIYDDDFELFVTAHVAQLKE